MQVEQTGTIGSPQPEYCVYDSFESRLPSCPRCESTDTAHQGGTKVIYPYRFRNYKCRECGWNFRVMQVETKHVMERLIEAGLCKAAGL